MKLYEVDLNDRPGIIVLTREKLLSYKDRDCLAWLATDAAFDVVKMFEYGAKQVDKQLVIKAERLHNYNRNMGRPPINLPYIFFMRNTPIVTVPDNSANTENGFFIEHDPLNKILPLIPDVVPVEACE